MIRLFALVATMLLVVACGLPENDSSGALIEAFLGPAGHAGAGGGGAGKGGAGQTAMLGGGGAGSAGAPVAGSSGAGGSAGAPVAGSSSAGGAGSAGAPVAGSGGAGAGQGGAGAGGAAAGQAGAAGAPLVPCNPMYACTSDLATSHMTGLVWRRMPLYMVTWPAAKAGCESLGAGWRLPTINELAPVFVSPDPATFPMLWPGATGWSSTPAMSGQHQTLVLGNTGTVHADSDTTKLVAMCVKE